jgi:AraC-like DNA-binding protein
MAGLMNSVEYNLNNVTLLSARPLVETSSREQMVEILEQAYAVGEVTFSDADKPFHAVANRAELDGVTLHFCSYDPAIEIEFKDMPGFRQMFCLSGAGRLGVGEFAMDLDRQTTCILPPDCDFRAAYGDHYSHLVLQFDEHILAKKYEMLFGGLPAGGLALPVLRSLATRRLWRVKAIAMTLASQLADEAFGELAIRELEQTLISTFLIEHLRVEHAGPGRGVRLASRPQSSRLTDYIQANWDQPLTVEAIASACGVSVRSVFAQFQREHGVSPMTYLRDLRLAEARKRLAGRPDVSVIDVAMLCGFASFGHFARRYRARFGELPSDTRSRRP